MHLFNANAPAFSMLSAPSAPLTLAPLSWLFDGARSLALDVIPALALPFPVSTLSSRLVIVGLEIGPWSLPDQFVLLADEELDVVLDGVGRFVADVAAFAAFWFLFRLLLLLGLLAFLALLLGFLNRKNNNNAELDFVHFIFSENVSK